MAEGTSAQGGGSQDTDARIAELEREIARIKTELGETGGRRADPKADDVRCPKCRFPMREVTQHGIVLDVCQGCHGVYFDNGEVDQLIRYIEEQSRKGETGFLAKLFGRQR